MPKKKKAEVEETTAEKVVKNDEAVAEHQPEPNFTYSIINDGNQIKKQFDGIATPQQVIITLFSCMIGDIKTNVAPEEYENILDFFITQYKAQLLPNA